MQTENNQESVVLNVEGRVAALRLNRPEVLNALDEEMLKSMAAKLKEASQSGADILVISGSGRGFSAGGDIKSMLSSSDEEAFLPIMDSIKEMIVTLYTLPMITISAIHGAAAGLGLSLALAADYVMADYQAKIAMNFIGIGLIPDGGGHFFLNQRLGEHLAKKVIWEGKMMTAHEALNIGLIDFVSEDGIQEAAEEQVQLWLKKPVKAMIETKTILSQANLEKLLAVLALEKQGQHKMRHTADHREGIQAFMQKRFPQFSGK